jgi:hypothetical protein
MQFGSPDISVCQIVLCSLQFSLRRPFSIVVRIVDALAGYHLFKSGVAQRLLQQPEVA